MADKRVLWLLILMMALVSSATTAAAGLASNVLSDVNNMLRDAKTAEEKAPPSSSSSSSVELLRFVNDDEDNDVDTPAVLQDQVRLLTKQLNALMTRRREDYEMLENNLRKSLRLTTDAANVDVTIRTELDQLRREVQALRETPRNKERLTVEWLQQSISEIRKQLVELQRAAGNVAKDMQVRNNGYEDLATIRNDFEQLKLELAAQRERQQQTDVYLAELREEILQQEEDTKHRLAKQQQQQLQRKQQQQQSASVEELSASDETEESNESLADHRRRHCRFQSEQIHALQLAQRNLRHQVDELKYHRIDERVRSIEVEQHRIANANFNLSRQIASLDKLHTSMLELLEDVEGLQTKMDKSVPELRHEISKLEFANAQISSEQNLVREEGKNAARSLQAMAVSVSALQDERDGVKKLIVDVADLQTIVDRVQSLVNNELRNKLSHANKPHKHVHQHQTPTPSNDGILAESLVAELEHVESEYEAIINKLPHDCSDVATNTEGLHLIAPAGQHHPLMAHCSADGWTTVQRRFDGSADFNRSWADYARGFGSPSGEFWMGNEQLHHLTINNCTRLRVLMQDIYDNTWVADYGHFYISSREDGYRLHIGSYSGNASDALNYQQGMQFSAIDDDRDISQTHCAANYEGGWWFSHCQHANLNGRYNLGLTWFDAARNEWIAVKSSQMLIKRHSGSVLCPAALTIPSGDEASASVKAKATTIPTTTTPTPVTATVVQLVDATQA